MEITLLINTIVLGFAVLVNLLLAVSVVRNNPQSATNRVYGLLSLVIVLWMITNYLSLVPALVNTSLLYIRLSVFFATAMSALFLLFANTMPNYRVIMRPRRLKVLGVASALTMLLTISPFVFTEVTISNNVPTPVPGPGIGLFSLVTTLFSILAITTLVKKIRSNDEKVRQQVKFILIGISIMLGLIIVTVLFPVVLFKKSTFVPFIPLYTIIFLGMTTIAIVRHRLFDIRAVIARSVAYLLTVTAFVIVYTGAVLVISYIFFKDKSINTRAHFTYIALALMFTPTVYWLKSKLDKLTNKLFYQDSYDSQAVLDELSGVLVGNLKLEELLKDSERVITRNLKVTFLNFAVYVSKGSNLRLMGNGALEPEKMKDILSKSQFGRRVVVTKELLENAPQLYETLRAEGIAVVAHISTHEGRVGYIVLGDRKSGNDYTSADLQLIRIIADELALGMQNALRFEEIQEFNETLQQKISEATKELRKTNEKLKALDEAKDEFISMASHQLRTPLTSIKGYVSMVLEGDAGKISGQQKQLLEQAFVSSQRMVYLIADLLNVSRLKTGKFVIEAKPTYLPGVVEGEMQQLMAAAKAHNLEMTFDKPASFPTLNLDETKTRQVIMNFMDNALYYTPSGGHIKVQLIANDKTVEYRVVDDGLGVPKEEQHHLFTKFFRADNARKVRPDGTGLGLYMAKKVIVAQGGAIIFESIEGKGSTFGFSFPRSHLEVKQ